jgi:hypothetical protein
MVRGKIGGFGYGRDAGNGRRDRSRLLQMKTNQATPNRMGLYKECVGISGIMRCHPLPLIGNGC